MGCNKKEPWGSSNYFIGEWEYESKLLRCCEECVENYETECTEYIEPFRGIYKFTENGKAHLMSLEMDTIRTFDWCYNALSEELVLKDIDEFVVNFRQTLPITNIQDNCFQSKSYNGIIYSIDTFKNKI